MTQKLYAVFATALVLCATPLAGTALAADAGNTVGNATDETAGNDSEATAGNESAGNDSEGSSLPFGLEVSSFVDSAKEHERGSLGRLVAAFVTQHNPGNAPDHAGPPSWLFGGSDGAGDEERDPGDRGPPGAAGPPDDGERGPPGQAGPPDGGERGPDGTAGPDGDGERPEGDGTDDGRNGPPERTGPPAHAGPP